MKFKKIHGVKTGRTRKQKVKNKNINVSEDLRLSVKSAVENEAKSGIEVSKKCCAGLDCKVLHRKKKNFASAEETTFRDSSKKEKFCWRKIMWRDGEEVCRGVAFIWLQNKEAFNPKNTVPKVKQ